MLGECEHTTVDEGYVKATADTVRPFAVLCRKVFL